jgi:ubiquinone/menaquinone biosynthesis C-methylase UbiE
LCYEDAWHAQLLPAQTRLLDMAALRLGDRVLDVACGTGLVTLRAARAVGGDGRVIGTDISEGMIELARGHAKAQGLAHAHFERMDAEQLGVDGDSIDVALCALGLMYVPDPLRALSEMLRVCKPGGRAVAAVWGRRDRCGWAEIFPIVDARVHSEVCPLFFALGTGDRLADTFARAGFAGVTTTTLDTRLHYASADEACRAAFIGGPVALAYSRFDEQTRAVAHAEYIASLEPYRTSSGAYEVPGEFVVTLGSKLPT